MKNIYGKNTWKNKKSANNPIKFWCIIAWIAYLLFFPFKMYICLHRTHMAAFKKKIKNNKWVLITSAFNKNHTWGTIKRILLFTQTVLFIFKVIF